MRILVLSDLHHELWREHAPQIDPGVSHPDVVILAGDINTGDKAVDWAVRTFPGLPVMYVHGNHEGYGHHLDDVQEKIQEACEAAGNVHFLNCGEQFIGRVRFLGATMWTDFRLFGDDERQASIREAEAVMTDYKRIRLAKKGYRKLRAADTAQFHSIQKSWLRKKLDEPFDGATVVITHMAPSMLSVADKFGDAQTSAAYASRLDDMVAKANLWVHGHMHESSDYELHGCRVVCNPCGYMDRNGDPENPQFDPDLVINLDG
ncbi:Icc-related predicted phosphoesterase [Duganella sp. 3397]|uniref:metallophosphoesterase n=1 Tax=Duganella sp. 3397 TaxID=2817732 RepID=UPI0028637A51|nr:metallophosphoesterase [Duganella sp. 3397]MDR7047763.1 Icc-related predicted phosphoesterase [Duganella sp. 3397]